jgi:hypothetical protein
MFDVRCSVPFEVRSFEVRSFSTFSLSMFGPFRCSVIRGSVIRRSVFRGSVFRGSVIRGSVPDSFPYVAANGNGKQKFVFLDRQTINCNRLLLFQQTCPSMLCTNFSVAGRPWIHPKSRSTRDPRSSIRSALMC